MDNDLIKCLFEDIGTAKTGQDDVASKQLPQKRKVSDFHPCARIIKARRQTSLDYEVIRNEVEDFKCQCGKLCQASLSPEEILIWRQKIHTHPQGPERMTILMEIIRESALTLVRKKDARFKINDTTVCRSNFIKLILNVSEATFKRAQKNLKDGLTYMDKATAHVLPQGARGAACKGFIEAYVKSTCDHDPTCQRYRMPHGLSRMDLYSLYESTAKREQQSEVLEKSQFYQILKDDFPNVSFNKNQINTKCTECLNLKHMIETEKNLQRRQDIVRARELHLNEQKNEREAYYFRRGQAEQHPQQILSIIIDGMDQKKTDLPHYRGWNNPNSAGQRKLKTHVVGAIAHGRNKYFMVDFNEYPHNTSMTLTVLLNVLMNEATENRLPPILYVQLDNTTRENKNKYFLGFLGYLVHKKYIKEAWLSFLIVGHTHEDIDQTFSKISHKLREETATTRSRLVDVIKRSQGKEKEPIVSNINTVWNISGWLDPLVKTIRDVTSPQMYRVFADPTGHVTIQYKELSNDAVWKPTIDEPALEIFKLDNDRRQKIPPGLPEVVEPKLDEEELQDLKRSVTKDYNLAAFVEEDILEWNTFLANPLQRETSEWPLLQMGEFNEETDSTLSEKDKALLEKYLQKTSKTRQVRSAGPKHDDRRKYTVGQYALVLLDVLTVQVGQITEVQDEIVTLKLFPSKGFKVSITEAGEIKTQYQNLLPGNFKLTASRKLPTNIQSIIKDGNYKLW